jgi:hypothetical protein
MDNIRLTYDFKNRTIMIDNFALVNYIQRINEMRLVKLDQMRNRITIKLIK